MEACVGARKLKALGHDPRLMPAKYVRPYSKGQERFPRCRSYRRGRSAPAYAAEQLDLQALHRVRERLVSQRTGIINQIRAILLERGIAVRQGLRFLRAELPTILVTRNDVVSPRITHVNEGPAPCSQRAATLPPGLVGAETDLDRRPYHHRTDLSSWEPQSEGAVRAGNLGRARRPKNWERHGLKSWIEPARAAVEDVQAGTK